jgi:hypothetical protein
MPSDSTPRLDAQKVGRALDILRMCKVGPLECTREGVESVDPKVFKEQALASMMKTELGRTREMQERVSSIMGGQHQVSPGVLKKGRSSSQRVAFSLFLGSRVNFLF